MQSMSRFTAFCGALVAAVLAAAGTTLAAEPQPWGLGLQPAATPIKAQVDDFHNLLLVIITAITLFVLALLIFVMIRFRATANPKPSKTTHNTLIEIIWTTVPVIILVIIAVPSFRLLYAQDTIPEAEVTIKATGMQWYWNYEYDHPEHGSFQFDSFMLTDEEAAEAGLPRLLATDTRLVIPSNTNVRFLVTAGDVLHAFAVPAFGIKIDGVPGRLNETWANVHEEGIYYGQCSELCGTGHAYMPIMVEVVSPEAFEQWLDETAQQLAASDAPAKLDQLADARVDR